MRAKRLRFLLCHPEDEKEEYRRHNGQGEPYGDDCEPQPRRPIPGENIPSSESAEQVQRDSQPPSDKPHDFEQFPSIPVELTEFFYLLGAESFGQKAVFHFLFL